MAKRKSKRILIIGDLHCGHIHGLNPTATDKEQAEQYDMYLSMLKKRAPFDICIVNGDAVTGEEKKSGGTELVTSGMAQQCAMAAKAIREAKAKKIWLTAGTQYHVGAQDFEQVVAAEVGGVFTDALFLEVNGVNIGARHKITGASLCTSLAKEITLNRQKHAEGVEPKLDILIRSHAHRFASVKWLGCIGIVTPALQTFSKYGIRECSGSVNFGIVTVDISESGEITWREDLAPQVMQYQSIKDE